MRQAPLLTLHRVCLHDAAGCAIGPIDWSLGRGQRIQLETATTAQYEALLELFSGRIRPAAGYIEEWRPVQVQSDAYLRRSLAPNRSITDYLNSNGQPEYVWLEQRRRSVRVLLDKLGLSPHQFRLPLKFQDAAVLEKFTAFRFMLSRADVLLGREIFFSADAKIGAALKLRWADFPATLIACAKTRALPGAVDTRLTIAADGGFSCVQPE